MRQSRLDQWNKGALIVITGNLSSDVKTFQMPTVSLLSSSSHEHDICNEMTKLYLF